MPLLRSTTDTSANQQAGPSHNPPIITSPNPNIPPNPNNNTTSTIQDHNASYHSSSSQADVQEVRCTPALDTLVSSIVCRILDQQGRSLVQSVLNPNAQRSPAVDQTIAPEHLDKLDDLDKVPDVVRCLRNFSGDASEFSSWKKSVERVLQIYENIKGTPKYFGILNVIRNKITGQADAALESYNTPLNWESICQCLVMHYADKRDVSTLEYQMISLVQGNNSIQGFYQTVYSHLSLILNKISCMNISPESMRLLTQTYRDKALDTFIRGLKGDLPRLLGIREPVDLPQALHLCLKLENQHFRTNYAQTSQGPSRRIHAPQTSFPPQRANTVPMQPATQRQQFFPKSSYVPQARPYQEGAYRSNYNIPPQYSTNPNRNFNQPRVNNFNRFPIKTEPLTQGASKDVKEINYQNRQQFDPNLGKFNQPSFQHYKPKHPNFHIDPEPESPSNSVDPNVSKIDDNHYDQTLDEYVQSYITPYDQCSSDHQHPAEEMLDYSDIHFLG